MGLDDYSYFQDRGKNNQNQPAEHIFLRNSHPYSVHAEACVRKPSNPSCSGSKARGSLSRDSRKPTCRGVAGGLCVGRCGVRRCRTRNHNHARHRPHAYSVACATSVKGDEGSFVPCSFSPPFHSYLHHNGKNDNKQPADYIFL